MTALKARAPTNGVHPYKMPASSVNLETTLNSKFDLIDGGHAVTNRNVILDGLS